MSQQKALIIGAGVAGMAAAIRLAVKGYRVEVFEANSHPGGKLAEFEENGFRFDAGPSLFTMPQYVDELFELAGRHPRDYFEYKRSNTLCNYFYADGSRLTAYADNAKFAAAINELTGEPISHIRKYLKNSERIYHITNHVFLERSLHRLQTYVRWDTFKSLLQFGRIDSFRTMHRANEGFFKDKRLMQLFDRYATYNGSSPYEAPATLNVIPHLEQHFGAFFPTNGMYSISTSLAGLAESLGVKFNYGSRVEEIGLDGKRANGITVNGKVIGGDIIVSNMDVWFTYQRLLKKHPALVPEKILNQERSSSALIFYWGINRQFTELDLHNIFFSEDYQAEFNAIWKDKSIYHDPTVYVNISSKVKPDDAPAGCENWFVMINAPSNSGQDWESLIAAARTNIIKKLSGILNVDVNTIIVCQEILDPRSMEAKTSSFQGSLYGTSSNNRFAAFLRHANKSSQIKNLYFCGGSVHPGGGIPLALLSAKIVADWVPHPPKSQ